MPEWLYSLVITVVTELLHKELTTHGVITVPLTVKPPPPG